MSEPSPRQARRFVGKMSASEDLRTVLKDWQDVRPALIASQHQALLPLLDAFESTLLRWANGLADETSVQAARAALLDALEGTRRFNTKHLWALPLESTPIPAN